MWQTPFAKVPRSSRLSSRAGCNFVSRLSSLITLLLPSQYTLTARSNLGHQRACPAGDSTLPCDQACVWP